MPRRLPNPLIQLAKLMSGEIDKFALRYDESSDKKAFVKALGKLHNLPPAMRHLYAEVTNAVGITDDVYSDAQIYMLTYHSNQHGIDKSGDGDRLRALVDFIIQAYVDVSTCNVGMLRNQVLVLKTQSLMPEFPLDFVLKHLEATGDKWLKGFNFTNQQSSQSSQHVQQAIVESQKISKAGKKIGLDGRTINTDGTSRKKRAVNFTQAESDELACFCSEHHELLEGDFQGPGREHGEKTAKKQQAMWQQICDKINSFGIACRDIIQLKRKWNSIKSEGNNCNF